VGIRAEWADANHQIYLFTIEIPWTWQEYRATADQAFGDIGQVDHPTATIVDVSQIKKLPQGDVLSNLQYIESLMPSNVVASVIVGAPYIVTAFMNVLTRLRPKAKRIALFARTMEEANTLIQQRFEQIGQEIPE
jgi:hypothetical protein